MADYYGRPSVVPSLSVLWALLSNYEMAGCFPINLVPTATPSRISYSVFGRLPCVITMSMPCAVTSRAARSFVIMPPVPQAEPAPPASVLIRSSISETSRIKYALQSFLGSAAYNPSTSDKLISKFALQSSATSAERGHQGRSFFVRLLQSLSVIFLSPVQFVEWIILLFLSDISAKHLFLF